MRVMKGINLRNNIPETVSEPVSGERTCGKHGTSNNDDSKCTEGNGTAV
jgi:hypothetical protein